MDPCNSALSDRRSLNKCSRPAECLNYTHKLVCVKLDFGWRKGIIATGLLGKTLCRKCPIGLSSGQPDACGIGLYAPDNSGFIPCPLIYTDCRPPFAKKPDSSLGELFFTICEGSKRGLFGGKGGSVSAGKSR